MRLKLDQRTKLEHLRGGRERGEHVKAQRQAAGRAVMTSKRRAEARGVVGKAGETGKEGAR